MADEKMTDEKKLGSIVDNDDSITNAEDLLYLQAVDSEVLEHSGWCRGIFTSSIR